MEHPPLKKVLIYCAAGAAVWLGSRYLLPIFLPFLMAGALALAAEPLVRALHTKLHLRRAAAAVIGVAIALTCAVVALLILCALALRQLGALSGALPSIGNAAVSGLNSLERYLLELSANAPEDLQAVLDNSVESLFSDSTRLIGKATDALLSLASGILTRIPDSALGFGTWIIASFMISIKLPQLRAFLTQRIPKSRRQQLLARFRAFRKNIGGWLTAQLKLILVTFGVLTCGLLLLGIPYALLWAALIAFVDALPVLGSGTILIPWGLVCLLQGRLPTGLGLWGIWGIATLLRTILEPRLVGKQLGLDPLVTLLAMYAGYRIWGILGMIFAPLLAVTAAQLRYAPSGGKNP